MSVLTDNPYVGLRPYGAGDQDRFFGRSRESREVSHLWQSNRLVVLYGPSGIGKTSLLHAGVLPALPSDRIDVLPIGRASHGSSFPTAALPRHNPFTFALLSSWSPTDSPLRLSGLTVAEFLRRRPRKSDRYGDAVPLLCAIDQFEDVLAPGTPWTRHRDAFLGQLGDATKEFPHLRLLISIREDSLGGLLSREADLAGHARARIRVSPLAQEAALAAVVGPVTGTARSFAPGAAESLVRDLRTVEITDVLGERRSMMFDTVEPWQLQVVCSALWEGLPADAEVITTADVHRFGDVGRALTDFYRRTVRQVAADFGIPEGRLRTWLERVFVTELGTRGTVYEGLSETGGMPNAVARALEERHVLRSERRAGARWYELQHDRLVAPIREASRSWSGPGPQEAAEPQTTPGPADYLRAAEAALADGEVSLAEKHAGEASRLSAGDAARVQAEAESFLGNIAFLRGRHEAAERHYRQAARLFEVLQSPGAVARLLAAIGRILMERGEYAGAIEELRTAVDRLPGDLALRVELARALWFSGQLNGASALFGSVLTVAPEHTEALSGRGQVLLELGDHAAALDDLERLIRLRPEAAVDPEVRAARALALAGVGRQAEALSEATAAVDAAPGSGPVLLRAGEVAASAGEAGDAIERLRLALDAAAPSLARHQFAHAREMLLGLLGPDSSI
ncbi:tetratricopeptide repeat protein [Thermopolyspora sp. NPDC052614]|uniref:tetratricopeptide repeat protein n=1 Tax=Thermopolyspora sp. NPDC052614 TaxID=3155682 RepID=UPI0034412D86